VTAYTGDMGDRVDCQCKAFQTAVEILGRPWNAFLLTMLQEGAMRFSEIAARPNGPGDKLLSARLKELEARGLVERHVQAGPPVKVSYELTKQGRAFNDVSAAIAAWGLELTSPRPRRAR
jgi:DNA-binding HxlR family transcriptional regulator